MEQTASPSPAGRIPPSALPALLESRPQAWAVLSGAPENPGVSGVLRLYQTPAGVLVWAEVRGLPRSGAPCQERILGFHIHQGTDCGGTADAPFSGAMAHFDTADCPHPYHAGDLPPLFATRDGYALSLCLTDRFTVRQVLGRTVILHGRPDDFTTQPAGNAGERIACGVIRPWGSGRTDTNFR